MFAALPEDLLEQVRGAVDHFGLAVKIRSAVDIAIELDYAIPPGPGRPGRLSPR